MTIKEACELVYSQPKEIKNSRWLQLQKTSEEMILLVKIILHFEETKQKLKIKLIKKFNEKISEKLVTKTFIKRNIKRYTQ